MNPVLVVGSVAFDTLETPCGRRDDILGGSATHFAFAARHFGKVRLVAVVGRDFPKEQVDLFERLGIDTTGLERSEGLTFRWHGKYEGTMSIAHTVSVQLNVLGDFQPKIPSAYRDTRHVLLGKASPTTQRTVLDQLARPEFVMMDTMDIWIRNQRKEVWDLLPRVQALCVNYEEALMLAQEDNVVRAGRKLLDAGVRMVIVKRAEHGATLFTSRFLFSIPAYPTETVVDPTGAGDAFAGGMLGSIARNGIADGSLKRSLVYGSVMGSLAVEAFGTQRLHEATADEVERRYRALQDMISL
ncbi:MAG: sugar kinase [Planctomycetes bacterium]|nr:sugar kinase [Planctomycetota bacterium]